MNLREIDALVAEKVMGHKKIMVQCMDVSIEVFEGSDPLAKFYSSDISAAWEVVEKFGFIIDTSKPIRVWNCGQIEVYDPVAENESAPLAICLAALRSVGVEV